MPWSHPAARMREFVLAMRAIWDCWNDGTKLDFRGDFYTHTLMTPFFDPGPEPARPAEGVPRRRRRAHDRGRAARSADGFICHAFTTERYLREVTLPALERGLAKAGRTLERLRDLGPAVRGHRRHRGGDGGGRARARASRSRSTARRPRTAACSSCTAGATCRTSSTRSRSRASGCEMGDLIDDEMLDTFAVVAEPERRRARS